MKPPGDVAPSRVTVPVSQADVFATVLSAAGVTASTDWSRPLEASTGIARRTIVSEFIGQGERGEAPHLYALRDGSFKLIVTDSGEERLFDLASDPEEKSELADENEKLPLRAALEAYRRAVAQAEVDGNEITLSDKVRDELKALGYLEP